MAFIMITLVIAYSRHPSRPVGHSSRVVQRHRGRQLGRLRGSRRHRLVRRPGPGAGPLVPGRLGGRGLCAGRREVPAREIFIRYAYLLVPLGLLAWAAFSFPLHHGELLPHHLVAVRSPGLGVGSLRHRGSALEPAAAGVDPLSQIPLLLLGLWHRAARAARRSPASSSPAARRRLAA